MEYEFHYSRFPALKSYIDRIGAEQLNFRRFMVKEYHGSHYYVEKVLIKITDDLEIDCRNPEYAPTEEEAGSIRDELRKVKFPRSMKAGLPEVDELLATGQVTGQLFIFMDSTRKHVLMCQERKENDEGKKYYVPWTMFGTTAQGGSGMWRQMEPDGKLPFWKPKVNRKKAHIMVHEGAKTAAYVDALINDPERRNERKAHPWANELADFEHWGAIGGALAIHRCDYDELHREKLEGDLFYVCDRDSAGEEAVKTFSKMWGGRLYAIKFDDVFREGWDLADKLPEAMYTKIGTVKAPLMLFKDPATWATKRMEKKEGAGRPGYQLTKDFVNEWVHTVDPEMYCHSRMTNKKYETAGAFNNSVRPFSDIDDTSRLLKQSYHNKAVSVKYDPARKPGKFQDADGNVYLNTYIPNLAMIPYTEKEAKHIDYSLIDEFFEIFLLVPEERAHVKKWVATLLGKPGLKMNYGLLLVSEVQGVGKTTLCNMIAKVLGNKNVSYPNESMIIGNFNDYAAEKQLAVVSEIYQGHSTKAYNQLKEVITDKTVSVNRKFVAQYTVDNHLHVIACSNSMRALRLDNSDRRWFIPQVNQVKRQLSYWTKFYDWFDHEDGARKFKLWAQHYVRDHGHVEVGAEAPWTFTKKEMIEENDTPGMEYLRSMFRRIRSMAVANGAGEEDLIQANGPETTRLVNAAKSGIPIAMFDGDAVKAINSEVYHGRQHGMMERPLHVRKIAKEEGLFSGKERVSKPAPGYKRVFNHRVIATSEEIAIQDPNELTAAGYDSSTVCLVDLIKLAREQADL